MNNLETRLQADADAWRRDVDATLSDIDVLQDAHRPVTAPGKEPRSPRLWLVPVLGAAAVLAIIAGVALGLRATHTTHPGGHNSVKTVPTAPASPDSLVSTVPRDLLRAQPTPSPVNTLTPGQTRGLISMPWRFVKLDHDRRIVDLMYVSGSDGCVTVAGFEVIETPNTVELLALSRADPTQQSCGAVLNVRHGSVTLQAPLGNRKLLHGPVDRRWEKTFPGN